MKHMHTPSQMFIAVRLDTTGSVLRKPFDVVKKFSIVVTPNGKLDKKREGKKINDQEIDKKLIHLSHYLKPDFVITVC